MNSECNGNFGLGEGEVLSYIIGLYYWPFTNQYILVCPQWFLFFLSKKANAGEQASAERESDTHTPCVHARSRPRSFYFVRSLDNVFEKTEALWTD